MEVTRVNAGTNRANSPQQNPNTTYNQAERQREREREQRIRLNAEHGATCKRRGENNKTCTSEVKKKKPKTQHKKNLLSTRWMRRTACGVFGRGGGEFLVHPDTDADVLAHYQCQPGHCGPDHSEEHRLHPGGELLANQHLHESRDFLTQADTNHEIATVI